MGGGGGEGGDEGGEVEKGLVGVGRTAALDAEVGEADRGLELGQQARMEHGDLAAGGAPQRVDAIDHVAAGDVGDDRLAQPAELTEHLRQQLVGRARGANTVVVVFAGAVVLELSIVVVHPPTSARHPATSAVAVTGRRNAPGFTR